MTQLTITVRCYTEFSTQEREIRWGQTYSEFSSQEIEISHSQMCVEFGRRREE